MQGRMSVETRPLGVVLVEPLHVVRAGLHMVISSEADMEVVVEAANADEAFAAMRLLKRRRNVLVLVSLGIEGPHDSFWLIRSVRDAFPSMCILACGANPDGITVSRALFTGADGFLDKGVTAIEFLSSMRDVARGQAVLGGVPIDAFGEVAEGLSRHQETESVLTEREREIITVAARGFTAREIGTRLGVRERTVTTHLANIYRKLGCNSRVSAVTVAQRSGLLTLASLE